MTSPVFLPIDGNTGFRKTIDCRHAQVHEGYAFLATHQVSVGTATAASLLIQTPSTASVTWHLAYEVSTRVSASVAWIFCEAPNTTVNANVVTPYNINRQSATTTGVLIYHTPVITSNGTVLENGAQGVTPAVQLGGTFSNGAREWILKRDTRYIISVTAYTAASSVVINACWYEEGR